MKWFEMIFRSSRPEVFYEKGLLKMCSKFTGEFPCWSAISIKLLCNFIEITLWHGCSPVNLLHIFRAVFLKNISRRLLLTIIISDFQKSKLGKEIVNWQMTLFFQFRNLMNAAQESKNVLRVYLLYVTIITTVKI